MYCGGGHGYTPEAFSECADRQTLICAWLNEFVGSNRYMPLLLHGVFSGIYLLITTCNFSDSAVRLPCVVLYCIVYRMRRSQEWCDSYCGYWMWRQMSAYSLTESWIRRAKYVRSRSLSSRTQGRLTTTNNYVQVCKDQKFISDLRFLSSTHNTKRLMYLNSQSSRRADWGNSICCLCAAPFV